MAHRLTIATADAPSGSMPWPITPRRGGGGLVWGTGNGQNFAGRGMAEGLLADPTAVSSPTFTLIHEYQGRLRLIHADLYRLTAAQLNDTGLSDYLDGHTITAIEWADRWGVGLPPDRLDIHLSHGPTATRRAILTATGPSACPVTGCRSHPPFEELSH